MIVTEVNVDTSFVDRTVVLADYRYVYMVHDEKGQYWEWFFYQEEAEWLVEEVYWEKLHIEYVPYSYFKAFIEPNIPFYHRSYLLQ